MHANVVGLPHPHANCIAQSAKFKEARGSSSDNMHTKLGDLQRTGHGDFSVVQLRFCKPQCNLTIL